MNYYNYYFYTVCAYQVMIKKLLGDRRFNNAATQIQRIWRGILGTQRSISKKLLDQAAAEALLAVDSRTLFSPDVKELAKRIQLAIEEPDTTSYPPDEVLHLLRLTAMIMEAGKEHTGMTTLSRINARYFKQVDGESLTWEQAMMLVNRSNRFVRLVRALAYAPGAKPPRLIKVPMEAQTLYSAQQHNPRWTEETFETMGRGSKCCLQIFKWVTAMMDIAIRQERFLGFIANVFRDWLPQLLEMQKISRRHEFECARLERRLAVMEEMLKLTTEDVALTNLMNKEIRHISDEFENAKLKLKNSQDDEEALRDGQTTKEISAMISVENKVAEKEQEVLDLAATLHSLITRAEAGDTRAEEALGEARSKLIMERVVLKELQVNLKLLEVQCGMNRTLRLERGRLPNPIKLKAKSVGEAEALNNIVLLKEKMLLRMAGVVYPNELDEDLLERYKDLQEEETSKNNTFQKLYTSAETALEEFNKSISRELIAKQTQTDLERFVPSEEEMEEERFEDATEAKQERAKRRQYVPDSVLYEHKVRDRPILLALARDIPGHLKQKIHDEITKNMPGLFVVLDVTENMGLDLGAMQDILDSKKSIILSVDHGLTKITRDSFIKNFNMMIKSLIPRPVVVFAMGDDQNMRLPSGESQFGVNGKDMNALRDKDIKLALEMIAYTLSEFTRPEIIHKMEVHASGITAPSIPYIIVLEALYIIQADHDNFRMPDYHIAAVSWHATQHLLQDPISLVAKLKAIPRGKANSHVCLCLSEYVNHRKWPGVTHEERNSDVLLHLLASYVELWTKCEQATLNKGGIPDKVFFKNAIYGLQSVVSVSDVKEAEDVLVADKRGGWRVPAAQLIRSCLQDLRVLKIVQKIDNQMYNINVYRDVDSIYFDTYEPSSSQLYLVSVPVAQVPDLLTPNTISVANGVNKDPPQTATEMYTRLTKLLRFEKQTKQIGSRKELLCHRDYTLIKHSTEYINGHTVLLICSEAALGELFFSAYIPEYSCRFKLLVDDDLRLKLRENFDQVLEKDAIDTDNALLLLPYVMDRLRIHPSRPLIKANAVDHVTTKAMMSKNNHQGISMKLRCRGGAGKKLLCTNVRFAGVPHLLTLRSVRISKTLRILSYEPSTQKMLEFQLSSIQRKLLLGSNEDDYLNWLPNLLKRLRLQWRGTHQLQVSLDIFKKVRKIAGNRMLVTISVIDETSIKITLLDLLISVTFSTLMTKDDVIRLIYYNHTTATTDDKNNTSSSTSNTSNQKKDKKMLAQVRKLLRGVISTQEVVKPSELDPTLFNIPMVALLQNRRNLELIANQLETVLDKVDARNNYSGYYSLVPVTIKVFPERNEETPAPFDTTIRYKSRLNRTVSDGSVASVIATRRQAKMVILEDELNLLAIKIEEEAKLKSLELQRISKELETSFMNENTFVSLISVATNQVASTIVDKIERKHRRRSTNKNNTIVVETIKMMGSDGKSMVDVTVDELTTEQREIIIKGDRLVFDRGVKINFRENKARWHGHVSVKVLEGSCWGGADGVMRRLKFIIFEPGTATYYTGEIRNSRHLREVLGPHAQDLFEKTKSTEMLLFITHHRLELVRNNVSWDGEKLPDGAPHYRVEFIMDRLFSTDKITPVNLGGDAFELANQIKLLDNGTFSLLEIIRVALSRYMLCIALVCSFFLSFCLTCLHTFQNAYVEGKYFEWRVVSAAY